MRSDSANRVNTMTTGISFGGPTPGGYALGSKRCAGFTLVEMFVVIAIILIIVALAVPGVNAMVYSSNRALAENSLRVAVGMARDAAIASSRSGDGAAVFLYDPESKQMRIVPAEVVGQMNDPVDIRAGSVGGDGLGAPSASAFQTTVYRDVLAPIALGQSITLPSSWMVRGYAAPGSMLNPEAVSPGSAGGINEHQWYRSENYQTATGATAEEGNWVFPESGFYDVDEPSALTPETRRFSFMVRFSARTGAVSRSDREAIFIDPRPSVEMRDDLAMSRAVDTAWKRVDWAEDTRTWAVRTLGRLSSQSIEEEVLSANSNDTVLVKSVNRLALYDERRLARGIGGRINQDTGSIYEPYLRNDRISFDRTLLGNAQLDQIRRNVNAWIDGDTGGGPGGPGGDIYDGQIDEQDSPEAALFTIQGYTGELTEIER